MWRKGNPCALLVGMLTGAATMENNMEVPQNLKTELPYDPAIPLLDIYLKEMKSLTQKDICTPVFIKALFTMKQYLMPVRMFIIKKT